MTNRREALVWMAAALAGLQQRLAAQGTLSAEEQKLQAELDELAKRVYSEEGIPMFLACENLAAPNSQAQHGTTALNQKLSEAFRRYADDWQHMHQDAKVADVAKIVELLANRDFAAGGLEAGL